LSVEHNEEACARDTAREKERERESTSSLPQELESIARHGSERNGSYSLASSCSSGSSGGCCTRACVLVGLGDDGEDDVSRAKESEGMTKTRNLRRFSPALGVRGAYRWVCYFPPMQFPPFCSCRWLLCASVRCRSISPLLPHTLSLSSLVVCLARRASRLISRSHNNHDFGTS